MTSDFRDRSIKRQIALLFHTLPYQHAFIVIIQHEVRGGWGVGWLYMYDFSLLLLAFLTFLGAYMLTLYIQENVLKLLYCKCIIFTMCDI